MSWPLGPMYQWLLFYLRELLFLPLRGPNSCKQTKKKSAKDIESTFIEKIQNLKRGGDEWLLGNKDGVFAIQWGFLMGIQRRWLKGLEGSGYWDRLKHHNVMGHHPFSWANFCVQGRQQTLKTHRFRMVCCSKVDFSCEFRSRSARIYLILEWPTFSTRWWFQMFFIFTPIPGNSWSNLTSIFFRWVGSTTNFLNFYPWIHFWSQLWCFCFTWGSEDETIPPMVAFQQLMQATDMTGSVSWCGQTPKMMVKQKPLEDWLVSWLVGWLVDSLIGCLLGWLVGWLVVVQSYTFCNLGCL